VRRAALNPTEITTRPDPLTFFFANPTIVVKVTGICHTMLLSRRLPLLINFAGGQVVKAF
jgi:hypothetical protein